VADRHRSLLAALLVVGSLALAACGSTADAPGGDDGGAATTAPADLERLADLVDEARADPRSCGSTRFEAAAPLVPDGRLHEAAQLHADDMHANGFMGHVGSDGSDVGERVARQGYAWSTVGENVAAGYATPDAVTAAWLASPGHCANVMRGSYAHLGLGRTGGLWVQVFARP
jgi:uncharacterized protein YkwD